MSRTDSELRCDDRVTQPMNQEERKSYASVLVLAAARRNAPGLGVLATGMTMTGKRLKTRIATVMQNRKPLRWLTITFAILSSMCLIGAFATSETKEQLEMGVSWYDEGKYITTAVAGTRTIRNESEAIDYARTLWTEIRASEINGEYTAYHQDDGTWLVMMTENELEPFSVIFTSSGVICEITQNLNDDRWLTDGEYVESTVMDAQELADVENWAATKLETLVPGLTDELRDFRLSYVRDVGDAKYVFISADPKDSTYDAGISVFIRINADHSYVLLMLQLSGNG